MARSHWQLQGFPYLSLSWLYITTYRPRVSSAAFLIAPRSSLIFWKINSLKWQKKQCLFQLLEKGQSSFQQKLFVLSTLLQPWCSDETYLWVSCLFLVCINLRTEASDTVDGDCQKQQQHWHGRYRYFRILAVWRVLCLIYVCVTPNGLHREVICRG